MAGVDNGVSIIILFRGHVFSKLFCFSTQKKRSFLLLSFLLLSSYTTITGNIITGTVQGTGTGTGTTRYY